jgi:hypothetical protein
MPERDKPFSPSDQGFWSRDKGISPREQGFWGGEKSKWAADDVPAPMGREKGKWASHDVPVHDVGADVRRLILENPQSAISTPKLKLKSRKI